MAKALLALLLIVAGIPAMAETLTGRVVGVHDGDTLTLRLLSQFTNQQLKVRLAGIDAPELQQPYGQKAKQALSGLAFGKDVRVETAGLDKYGRTLGVVFVGALNVNGALVEQGAAWVYRQYPYPSEWERLEATAQSAKVGLWALQADQRIAPWDFRHKDQADEPTLPVSNILSGKLNTFPECGRKQRCSQMRSCDEAMYYLKQCKVSTLDGDGDGRPCDSLCR